MTPCLTPAEYFAPYSDIIPDFAAFCRSLSDPQPLYLRINTLKASVTETRLRLERKGFVLEEVRPLRTVFRTENIEQPGHLLEFSLGHLHSQTLSSVLAGIALDPNADEAVLDLCAAPGSKTSLLAQLMQNKGIIGANDKNSNRLIPLQANLKRLGVANAIIVCYPGQDFPKRFTFDRILVDVPCSAEGTLRATSNGTLEWPTLSNARLPRVQRDLILRAFDLLNPGGFLVYSTCTYNPKENESVVQFLLGKRQAEPQPLGLDVPHSPGLDHWKEISYDPSIKNCGRIYPHQLDTVGFFLAKVFKQV